MRVRMSGVEPSRHTVTRRGFVKAMAGASALLLLSACAPSPPPAPTAKPTEAPKPAPAGQAPAAQPTAAPQAPAAPKPAAQAETARAGGTMVLALQNHGGSLDPGTNSDGNAFGAMVHLYDPLVRVKPVSPTELNAGTPLGEIGPGLADSWQVAEDGLTWTFKLRQGAKFQDGTAVTVDAVINSIDRNLNENNPYYYKGRMINATAVYGTLASYRAVDPTT